MLRGSCKLAEIIQGQPQVTNPIVVGVMSGLSRRQQVLTMSAVYAVLFLLGLETTIGGSLLPQAARALDGFDRFPWTGTLQMLASACATPITARLGDMWGRKRLLQVSIALLSLSGLGSGLAVSMEQLLAMRLLNGVALGMMAATAFALPADAFADPAERVRWQSLGGVMFAVASSLGPLLGASLDAAFGWRVALLVVPAATLPVLLILALAPGRRPVHHQAQQFDLLGGVLLCLFIFTSLMGLKGPFDSASAGMSGVFWFTLCVAAFMALWKRQLLAAQPILSLDILRSQPARLIVLSTLLSGAVVFILLFYSPTLLMTLAGFDMAGAGAMMLPLLLGMPVGSVLNGLLFRRQRRPQRLMATGALLLLFGCMALLPLGPDSPRILVLVGFGFCGIGLGLINQNQTLFMQIVAPMQHVGAATGLISTSRSYGSAVGSALFGLAASMVGLHDALILSLELSVVAALSILILSLRLRLP